MLEGMALEWIHAESLIGVCHVERVSAAVFHHKVSSGHLPTHIPCFFTREIAPDELDQVVLDGVFLPTANSAQAPSPTKSKTHADVAKENGQAASRKKRKPLAAMTRTASTKSILRGGSARNLLQSFVPAPTTTRSAGQRRQSNLSTASLSSRESKPGLKLPVMGPGRLSTAHREQGASSQ